MIHFIKNTNYSKGIDFLNDTKYYLDSVDTTFLGDKKRVETRLKEVMDSYEYLNKKFKKENYFEEETEEEINTEIENHNENIIIEPIILGKGEFDIESNNKLSITKRKYLNPKNNKWIGYARAKTLKLT